MAGSDCGLSPHALKHSKIMLLFNNREVLVPKYRILEIFMVRIFSRLRRDTLLPTAIFGHFAEAYVFWGEGAFCVLRGFVHRRTICRAAGTENKTKQSLAITIFLLKNRNAECPCWCIHAKTMLCRAAGAKILRICAS